MTARKIKHFPVDGAFNPWRVFESDLSEDAKIIFTMLYLNPSRLLPTDEEKKKYTSIVNGKRVRDAVKELEIRGVIIFGEDTRDIFLRDDVKPAPEGSIIKLPEAVKPKVGNEDIEQIRVHYMSEYMRATGERYPWAWGKDNKAAQSLIKNFGVEGAKLKIKAAFATKDEFLKKQALSIMGVVGIASRLVQEQIQTITQAGKWEAHDAKQIKLNGRGAQ